MANMQTVEIDTASFDRNVATETYEDIRNSKELLDLVESLARRTGYSEPLDLASLPDVGPNEVRVAGSGPLQRSADLMVRVAETNVEILLGADVEGADIHVSEGAEGVLKRKLLTSGRYEVSEAFGRILELNGIPDIRTAVVSGALDIKNLWILRQRKLAREFRSWLRQADVDDARELERVYVRSLAEGGIDSIPVRILRFALTSVLGVVSPIAGFASDAADSFFVSRFAGGFRPRLMLDELRKLTLR